MCIDKIGLCYKIVSVLLLFLGVTTPFFLMRYGINFTDEPYQIMNAMEYLQNPSTIFSSYIYNILGNTFGFELLKMRIIMAIISIVTVIIPVLYFYLKRRSVWETMFVGGLALLLMSAIQQKSTLVGWDILSNLCLSFSTVIILTYMEGKKNIALMVLLGVFVAMTTLSRIPNIILVPITLIAIIINKKYTHKFRDIVIYFASLCTSVLLIIKWIYGDLNAYIIAWNEWGFTDNHNLLNLLEIYVNDCQSLVCVIGLITLVYVSLYVVSRYNTKTHLKSRKYIVALIWFIFFIKLLYKYEFLNILTNSLYNSIYLLMLLYIYYKNRNNIVRAIQNRELLIIFLCSLVSAAGSDTGCFKIANITSILYLLPMFLPISSKIANNTIAIVILSILMYFPCSKARESFSDEGIVQATTMLNLPNLTGIYTTPANSEILVDIYEAEKTSSVHDVLFVGFGRQIFEYMLDCRANYSRYDFFGLLDDKKYILQTKTYLEQNPTIKRVYVVNKKYLYDSPLDSMLENNGYKLSNKKSCYKVYDKVN